MNWIERATRTLELESQAIAQLVGQLDGAFEAVGQLILDRPGRVIMTGIGKSAIIAQKLVATFNSTGTPAVFMHAADAIHGDLGLVQSDDVVLCISKSGNSPEIKALTPLIKSRSIPLIGMVGNMSFEQLTGSPQTPQQTIHRAVLQVLSHCAPYLGEQQTDFYRECELIDARLLDTHYP